MPGERAGGRGMSAYSASVFFVSKDFSPYTGILYGKYMVEMIFFI